MFGDFSRRTFDSADGYRAVLLQQGRVVLDADVNEQAEITAYHDETRTLDTVGAHGGPLGDGFRIIDSVDGSPVPWEDLQIAEGRYYVGGVLCECGAQAPGRSWRITEQPMAPRQRHRDDKSTAAPVNGEPQHVDRRLLQLDVWQRSVGTDEDPSLLEPALGGPDTAVRSRTTWQIRTVPVETGAAAEPPLLAPRRPTTAGRVIENRLYRVQVHHGGQNPSLLWSRDNAGTVARLKEISVSTTGTVLIVDRDGPDEDRAFRKGQLVELTSLDRELARAAGTVATIDRDPVPDPLTAGIRLHVTGAGLPTSPADLGLCPIVRGWDCPSPIDVTGTWTGTISVDDGALELTVLSTMDTVCHPGDHWLIPVRTVPSSVGTDDAQAYVDWPVDANGPVPRPPSPEHRYAPLAVVVKEGGLWKVEQDCRTPFAPLTEVGKPALHLLGGDGQEALPGAWLRYPVRVALRRGGAPVTGRTVQFTVTAGELAEQTETRGTPLEGAGDTLAVTTDGSGVAAVRWRLPATPSGSPPVSAFELTARHTGGGASAEVRVTGRIGIASEVAWTAPDSTDCDGYAGDDTVQEVLTRIVTTRQTVLLDGDGQSAPPGVELPLPVRIAVLTGGRPLPGVRVEVKTPDGHLSTGRRTTARSPAEISPVTDDHGIVSVRWLPRPDGPATQTLTATPAGGGPVVRVTAHLVHARHTPWSPPSGCTTLTEDPTVQGALHRLATAPRLRVLGGDNQQIGGGDEVAAHPVRVVVESMCGPASRVPVFAVPSGTGRVAPADPAQPRPDPLPEPAPGQEPSTQTGDDGTTAFWWQPGTEETPTLRLHLGDATASLVVGATRRSRPEPGLHITAIGFDPDDFGDTHLFRNDTIVNRQRLIGGIHVRLDGPADPRSWVRKPVLRVLLELPWPKATGEEAWFTEPVAVRPVELTGDLGEDFDPDARPTVLSWRPAEPVVRWLDGPLWEVLGTNIVRGRLVIDGWAVVAAGEPGRHLNTHTQAVLVDGRTDLPLPTDDAVAGGTYVQWFTLRRNVPIG